MELPNLHSLGSAAQVIQQLPDRVRLAATQLGIEPATYINNVPYYAESDLERIATLLRTDHGAEMIRQAEGHATRPRLRK